MSSLETRTNTHAVVEVPTTTLDAELANVPNVRFLKCDAEGHEHEVLLGGIDLLRRDRPVIFVEIEQRHRERPVAETFDLLEDLGYHGQAFNASGMRRLADFDVERDQLAVIADDPSTPTPPKGYVNEFVFVASATALLL